MSDGRPDPSELLQKVQEQERQSRRGKLKIFFGPCPGVGKTYAMLRAVRKLTEQGVDVLVGYVEVHKRADTKALLLGLEILPRKTLEYRGTKLEEFDLELALERRPQILVVDELAHTNAPGSRYNKRYEDVQALLEAGINVYTTLNVQHLESLNDVVSEITGISIRETVPDAIFEQADEVELIDLPPDALLERLHEGKVYVPEAILNAAANFFRKGNLTALRELALRKTAEWVDIQMRLYKKEHGIQKVWQTGERILVCIAPNSLSPKLLRASKRLAVGLHADLIALYVETPKTLRLPQKSRDWVVQTLKLAETLEAETVTVTGISVAEEVVSYARSRNVSKIVIGKSPSPRWRERLFGSTVSEVIRRSGELDVYAIQAESEETLSETERIITPTPIGWRPYGFVIGIVAALTGICSLLKPWFDISNIAMIYLLGVLVSAIFLGRRPSILASILSVAAFDFFFVAPRLSFAVSDTQYLITFLVMLAVALVISRFTTRIREQMDTARQQERRTAALFAVTRELAASRNSEEILEASSRHLREVFDCSVAFLIPDSHGKLAISPHDKTAYEMDSTDLGAAQWSFEHGSSAGLGTNTLPAARGFYIPLFESKGKMGVVGLRPHKTEQLLTPGQIQLLETFMKQIGLALERASLIQEAQHAQLQAETERVRSALLSSVSHDLRTPLATITGAASALQENPNTLDAPTRQAFIQSIYEEAGRLNRLIENLVFATRLESGSIELRRDWISMEEVVGSALARMKESIGERKVQTVLDEDLPLVRGDGLLLEQVIVNLVENSLRHTPEKTPLEISSFIKEGNVLTRVQDHGPGLQQGEEEKIFERFYRGKGSLGSRGMGLGLYICRGIVEAHGGRIWAENPAGKGAAFFFSLPIESVPQLSHPEK